jgi:hypothetical protein
MCQLQIMVSSNVNMQVLMKVLWGKIGQKHMEIPYFLIAALLSI